MQPVRFGAAVALHCGAASSRPLMSYAKYAFAEWTALAWGVRIRALHTTPAHGTSRLTNDARRLVRPRPKSRPLTNEDLFQKALLEGVEKQFGNRPPWAQRTKRHDPSPQSWGAPYGYRIASAQQQYSSQASTRRGSLVSNQRIVILLVGIVGVGTYYIFHLQKVPSTGRWRFMDVNMRDELAVGKDAYQQTIQTYAGKMLPPRSPAVTQVQRVVSRIAAAAAELDKNRAPNASPTNWTVHVIRDPQKNAFVLPGGNIFVFTGILPVCKNDDGLATVLSHEISHQLARHSAEKMSGYKVLMIGTFLLDLLGFDIGLSRIGLNLLLTLPNSRTMETEADTLGLHIMAQACFNPREAIDFWKRMDSEDGGHESVLADKAKAMVSTHPVNSQRIQNIKRWLPEELEIYEKQGCGNTKQFRGAVDSLAA